MFSQTCVDGGTQGATLTPTAAHLFGDVRSCLLREDDKQAVIATGCITTPCASQQHGVTGKLRFGCLRWPDQRLTNTVHSFMVRHGCNGPVGCLVNVPWATAKGPAQARAGLQQVLCVVKLRVLYSIYVCIQPKNLKPYFSLSSQVWKLFLSEPSSTLQLLKMELGSNGRFNGRCNKIYENKIHPFCST